MNDDLLVTWKDIAAYLKCSVRKAQRLEDQNLPVKRIPNTKAVWASKAEIDQWLKAQSLQTRSDLDRPTRRKQFRIPGQFLILMLLLVITVIAALSSAYAPTVVLVVVETTFLAATYRSLRDSLLTRAAVGMFLIAGISYAIVATSMPAVLSGVVNMTTLPPAAAYPFGAGLRLIPIPILICAMFVFERTNTRSFDRSLEIRAAYMIVGAVLIAATAITGFLEMPGIWRAHLSIRWTLLAGESFICAVNLGLLAAGYTFFKSRRTNGSSVFMSQCAIACILIALTAAINSRHWTEIAHSDLDALHPRAYRVMNPSAVADFKTWLESHRTEAGKDFVALSDKPEFLYALENRPFYKQEFDEAFQLSRRAVIFGFKDTPTSSLRRPEFLLVRFPADLAAILRFERVNQGNQKMASTGIGPGEQIRSKDTLP